MSDEQIKGAIRGFLKAMVAGDSAQAVSFVAQDVVWVEPSGTHKGASEIGTYVERLKKAVQDYRIVETGIGILVQGNTGVIEHNLAGTSYGKKWEIPATCIYEFKNNKMQSIRTFYDRLEQARQAASGPIERTTINAIVKKMVKPLR